MTGENVTKLGSWVWYPEEVSGILSGISSGTIVFRSFFEEFKLIPLAALFELNATGCSYILFFVCCSYRDEEDKDDGCGVVEDDGLTDRRKELCNVFPSLKDRLMKNKFLETDNLIETE